MLFIESEETEQNTDMNVKLPQWTIDAAREIQPDAWYDGEIAALNLCDRKTAAECKEAFILNYAKIIAKHAEENYKIK